MSLHTLLLRLAGPMQSWGTQSRFGVRDTGLEPSKSGVIGLLCAALGRPRSEALSDLNALRMGVRVEQEGKMLKDYHTAMDILKACGKGTKDCELSTRYYLADADFIVGLEGSDLELLRKIDSALRNPCWPLFLGRKSFPPGWPVWIRQGLRQDTDLETALKGFIDQDKDTGKAKGDNSRTYRLIIEAKYGQGETVRTDFPLSFAGRHFTVRHTRTDYVELNTQEN